MAPEAVVSMIPPRGWSEPFHESAYWAAMILAAALAVALWRVWMPFVMRTMSAAPALHVAATIGLAEVGVALLAVSAWRRRYPPIAATVSGFVANNFFLRLTSYAAPLFLTVGAAGAWAILGLAAPANVYALLAMGMLLLVAGLFIERHYPPEALDFAGVLAMVFSAFNASASAQLGARVLFAGAAIFLIRHLRAKSAWLFWAFVALTASGVAKLKSSETVSTPGSRKADKQLRCVQRAHGDVARLQKCA